MRPPVHGAPGVQDLPGLTRLAAAAELDAWLSPSPVDGASGPTLAQRGLLAAAGLKVSGFRHLPLAVVCGTKAQMIAVVAAGAARDVSPNDTLQ